VNQEQAFEAVGQANPLPSESTGPGGFLSMTALLDRIDERSTKVQTQERPRTELPGSRDQRPGWLIPALAGAAAIILAIVVSTLLLGGGSDEPDVIEPAPTSTTLPEEVVLSPLTIAGLYNEAMATGDWTALRALYADTAELEVNSVAGETFVERVSLAGYVPQTPYDWDGDGSIDGFDGLTDDAARQHAIGTTTFVTCSQVDDVTAACREVWEGSALSVRGNPHNNWTLTIIDGAITLHVIEVVPGPGNPIDSNLVGGYRTWINDNRPELSIAELFEDISRLAISPDAVPVHRELIVEWQAQR